MRYADGQLAEVGDKVQCWNGCLGLVVASMDTAQYLPGYESWSYLGSGVMIDTELGGLIHYQTPERSMSLLERRAGWKPTR